MAKPNIRKAIDQLIAATVPVDFAVEADDFILYELNRLIEEDRASFEDAEFRLLIDEGIHSHLEENLPLRASMARGLRSLALDDNSAEVARRIYRALEDTESDLKNVAFVVQRYTAYLFERLQRVESAGSGESEAQAAISDWKAEAIAKEELIERLNRLGRAAVGPAADLLLEANDRASAETALAVLSNARSAVSARVLAYAVAEPLLDEDLEARAFAMLCDSWPLAKGYILHQLHAHLHEDIPFRWFQLLVEVQEPAASELIYEELRVHGGQENFLEDLWALTSLLSHSRDPEIEDKVLDWLNAPRTPRAVMPMLQEFLKAYRKPEALPVVNPWSERARLQRINDRYNAAARLWDSGRYKQAEAELDRILQDWPGYPFAVNLKSLVSSRCRT